MITTLTANPSVDRTLNIDRWDRGAVIRAQRSWSEAGGKGVNISLALASAGLPTRAVLPLGGSDGREIEEQLANAGVAVTPVEIAGKTRTNVSVVEDDGSVTKLNEPGPVLSPVEVDKLVAETISAAEGSTWVVASGSLPPQAPPDLYARISRAVTAGPVKMAVDTSGDPLVSVIEAGPSLVKPNHIELSELVGRRLGTIGEAAEAARSLTDRGIAQVLVSLGGDGALLVNKSTVVFGEVRPPAVQNTVGAGDALLAGYLAGGAAGAKALENALAWACAAVRSARTAMERPGTQDYAAVRIHDDVPVARELNE